MGSGTADGEMLDVGSRTVDERKNNSKSENIYNTRT